MVMSADFILRYDGESVETSPRNGKRYSLKELSNAVNGYVECVRLPDGRLMWVNEEGRMLNLPVNTRASELAGRTIVGPVLVCASGRVK